MKKRYIITTTAILSSIAIVSTPAVGQLSKRSKRPFISSIDGKLVGRLDGQACGKTVSLTFTGTSDKFADGTSARRMMNNVVRNLRSSCGSVTLVAAKGVSDGRVVYNAIAESSSNWLLLELGGGNSGGLLSSGDVGKSGDLSRFAASKQFIDLGSLFKRMGSDRFLCAQKTAMGCTAATEFRNASSNGATLITSYLLDNNGTRATVSYNGKNSGGYLCANPQNAKITVSGGKNSPTAKARLAKDLRERLEPYGTKICSGWQTSGKRLIGANFNDKGAKLGKAQVLTSSSTLPKLRREN